MKIRFGTDGWRAVMGREFTFANLRRVVQAVCEVHIAEGARRAVIGYDNRFLARRFADETAAVVMGNGLKAIMAEHPTPVVMLSALTGPQTDATIKALEMGAVDCFLKSSISNPAGKGEAETELINKVKVAASIPKEKLRAGAIARRGRRPEKKSFQGLPPKASYVLN